MKKTDNFYIITRTHRGNVEVYRTTADEFIDGVMEECSRVFTASLPFEIITQEQARDFDEALAERIGGKENIAVFLHGEMPEGEYAVRNRETGWPTTAELFAACASYDAMHYRSHEVVREEDAEGYDGPGAEELRVFRMTWQREKMNFAYDVVGADA